MIDLTRDADWLETLSEEFMVVFRPLAKEHTYNSSIVTALLPILNPVDDIETDRIGRYVYIARQQVRTERERAYADKMIADDWLPLTNEIVKYANKTNSKVKVVAKMTSDWLSQRIEQTYKTYVSPDGKQIMLMKPRARSRGFYINRFENAFCKLV